MAALKGCNDAGAIARFASSDWSAGPERDATSTHLVAAYGSRLLLEAARRELLPPDELVARVDSTHLGAVASICGNKAAPFLLARLNAAFDAAMGAQALPPAPLIELDLEGDEEVGPHFVSVSERERKLSLEEFFDQTRETDEEFEAKQRNYHARYAALNGALSAQGAHLVLNHVSATALSAIVEQFPQAALGWSRRILALNTFNLPRICNFALQLARVLSRHDAEHAKLLFAKVGATHPIMHIRIGLGELPLEAHCIWQASDGDAMRLLRRERLLQASDDAELATETLAACRAGKWAEAKETVDYLLASEMPTDNARALMILGYGDQDSRSEAIFARFGNAQGLLGDTLEAARGAYDRNVWAREWHRRMTSALSLEEFWCASVLLRKLIDGRIDLWEAEHSPQHGLAECYALLRRRYNKRIAKWAKSRSAKLFGLDAPDPVFLGCEDVEE